MVVLHERFSDAVSAVALGLKALQEKPALIVKTLRLDQQQSRKRRVLNTHLYLSRLHRCAEATSLLSFRRLPIIANAFAGVERHRQRQHQDKQEARTATL